MEDVTHIHKIDANEQVYCHCEGDIVTFDGPFVAKNCWACPLWAGLDDGTAVVCIYDDPNASQAVLTYTKPKAAMAEAPEHPDNMEDVSSMASLAAMQARMKLTDAEGRVPTSVAGAEEEEVPAEEGSAEEKPAKKKKAAKPAEVEEDDTDTINEIVGEPEEKSYAHKILAEIKKSLPR